MKLRLLLASCVIALAACANMGGTNATEANILQGTDAAMEVAKTLYLSGKLSDAEAQSVVDAANAIVASLEAARSAAATGDKNAQSTQLRAAADAVDALMARLAARKGK